MTPTWKKDVALVFVVVLLFVLAGMLAEIAAPSVPAVCDDSAQVYLAKSVTPPVKAIQPHIIKPAPPEPTEEVTLPIPLSDELVDVLVVDCEKQGVPLPIAVAVMDKETGGTFNVDAVGIDGHDIGVFQIRKSNHAWLSEETGADPLTPSGNIECGVWMLSYLYDYYDQNWNAALTCYRWGTAYGDDSEYARDVLGKADKWEAMLSE